MSLPLWQPDAERMQRANLSAFMGAAARDWNLSLPDYPALYRWSIEHPEQFWRSVWDFGRVRASLEGEVVLENGDRMPGARWFPEARLNFAENLLRRRDAADAIVFWGEDKVRRRMSVITLRR